MITDENRHIFTAETRGRKPKLKPGEKTITFFQSVPESTLNNLKEHAAKNGFKKIQRSVQAIVDKFFLNNKM
jgi:hypothetical protein